LNIVFTGAAVFIAVNVLICLYRMVKGPTMQDRLLTLSIVGSNILAVLVLLALVFESTMYLDVAMLLVLVSFIIMILASRYLETHGREVDDSDS